MAAPANLLTTTGTVIDVIELVSKAIRTATELRNQWKEANLSVFLLESQLNALNNALTKVNMWVESDVHDPHHQLVMDMDRCIECCRILVVQIEKKLSHATRNVDSGLNFDSKLKLLWKSKDIKRVQKALDRQTNALTLLLTACNLARISDQKNLLERRETRQVLKKVEDDAVSLFVHRDVESLLTFGSCTTIRASKRSLRFEFDKELFISRVYDKWIRGSIRKHLRDQQPGVIAPRRKSSAEDLIQLLRSDPRRPRDALLLGGESRMGLLRLIVSRYSHQDLLDYKPRIIQSAEESVKTLLGAMRHAGIAAEDGLLWERLEMIAARRFSGKATNPGPNFDFSEEIDCVLQHPSVLCFLEAQLRTKNTWSTQYFLREAKRIGSTDYLPNETDIVQYMVKCPGVYRMKLGHLNIFAITNEGDDRKELLSYFGNVASIIFTIDMRATEQHTTRTDDGKLAEILALFAEIGSSRLNRSSSVIIIFTNVTCKKGSENATSVLKIDDIDGNTKKRVNFMRSLFRRMNADKHILYEHYLTTTDHHAIECIKNSVSSTTILRGFGLH